MSRLKTIVWADNCVRIIDQTKLPCELIYLDIATIEAMFEAIRMLRVRGAPAIGIAAAFGLYLGARTIPDDEPADSFVSKLDEQARYLSSSRPTAVNLFWALDRMRRCAFESPSNETPDIKRFLFAEAMRILDEDRVMCWAIGNHGFSLIKDYDAILTHCNAGGLATSEYGTALACVYVAQEKGKLVHVFSDETRPLLQGSRITAFELAAAGIPVTVICDNMAATVMKRGMVQAVIVGADRIAANGDTANKIGTYGVALLARAHHLPFYVAAPSNTFDLSLPDGGAIPIEERAREEITCGFGKATAPEKANVFNPAFDVTPNELITAIITEKGIVLPPFSKSIASIMA